MKSLNILYAFLGGAIVGCGAAILLAPEKGAEVRAKICAILKRKASKSATTKSTPLWLNSQIPKNNGIYLFNTE